MRSWPRRGPRGAAARVRWPPPRARCRARPRASALLRARAARRGAGAGGSPRRPVLLFFRDQSALCLESMLAKLANRCEKYISFTWLPYGLCLPSSSWLPYWIYPILSFSPILAALRSAGLLVVLQVRPAVRARAHRLQRLRGLLVPGLEAHTAYGARGAARFTGVTVASSCLTVASRVVLRIKSCEQKSLEPNTRKVALHTRGDALGTAGPSHRNVQIPLQQLSPSTVIEEPGDPRDQGQTCSHPISNWVLDSRIQKNR